MKIISIQMCFEIFTCFSFHCMIQELVNHTRTAQYSFARSKKQNLRKIQKKYRRIEQQNGKEEE